MPDPSKRRIKQETSSTSLIYIVEDVYKCRGCQGRGHSFNTQSGKKKTCSMCSGSGKEISKQEHGDSGNYGWVHTTSRPYKGDGSLMKDDYDKNNTRFGSDGYPYFHEETLVDFKCHACEGQGYRYNHEDGSKIDCYGCKGQKKRVQIRTHSGSFRGKYEITFKPYDGKQKFSNSSGGMCLFILFIIQFIFFSLLIFVINVI